MEKPNIIRNSAPVADSRYYAWIEDVKSRFHAAQVKSAIKVNTEMLQFYWSLGRDIVTMKAEQAWGTGVLQQISLDLRNAFPGQKGFSYTNIKSMSQWYRFYSQDVIIRHQLGGELDPNRQQIAGDLQMPEIFGRIPWRHHVEIVSHCNTVDEAFFYVEEVAKNNWSRQTLEAKLKSNLYATQGRAITNFDTKLPTDFKPKATAILKDDNPTIGLLICGSKDKTTVEWSLSDIAKPLGVASYELEKALEASLNNLLDSPKYNPEKDDIDE